MILQRGALGWSVGWILVACGGATADAGGGDGSTLRTCSILAGTYTQHFTTGRGGHNCPTVAHRSFALGPDEPLRGAEMTAGAGGFGLTDGGPGCTSSADSSTC